MIAYNFYSKYVDQPIESELERAGIIQLFEIVFELSWKVLKDYLEVQEIIVKSPRDAIKMAIQLEVINQGHIWLDALADRNQTVHAYDEVFAKKMVDDIINIYYPEIAKLYNTMISLSEN